MKIRGSTSKFRKKPYKGKCIEKSALPAIDEFVVISSGKVRYSDTDRHGHVNNAVFSSFFETGRVEIFYNEKRHLLCPNCSFVIASIKLDYLYEITWPGEIQMGTRITKIGRSSLNIQQGLYQNGKCTVLAETVIVQVHDGTKESEALCKSA